jgi:hypothetical protein
MQQNIKTGLGIMIILIIGTSLCVFLTMFQFKKLEQTQDIKITDATEPSKFSCQENKDQFSKYPDFFKEKSYINWCQECVVKNGKPQISHDIGPFCNPGTLDGGKICTDKKDCEGYCQVEKNDAKSGKCSENRIYEDGCGCLEMVGGKVLQVCGS